ncbi:hypothetical protein D3C73_861230 [compost metagenome]
MRGHVDAVHVREADRRRGGREVHLVGAGGARHVDDFAAGGAAHDGVIDQQHVLALELHADGVELLAHGLTAHGLARHDEGAAHVAVLDEPFAVVQVQAGSQLHGGGTRGIRNRHDDVDVAQAHVARDLVGQVFTHAQAGVVDRHAVDQRIRTREVHVFENAGHQLRVLGALAADETAVQVDEHGFTGLDITHEDKAAAFQRHGFRGHHPFHAFFGFHAADTQRANAVGVAESQQAVTGNLRHDGIGATHALMHGRHRAEDGVVV